MHLRKSPRAGMRKAVGFQVKLLCIMCHTWVALGPQETGSQLLSIKPVSESTVQVNLNLQAKA